MSNCIDRIYKDLTKGRNAPQGGVGFLSLEDADVSCDKLLQAKLCKVES